MYGWLYRKALALKEVGERVHCRTLIIVGLRLKDFVLAYMKTKHIKNKE